MAIVSAQLWIAYHRGLLNIFVVVAVVIGLCAPILAIFLRKKTMVSGGTLVVSHGKITHIDAQKSQDLIGDVRLDKGDLVIGMVRVKGFDDPRHAKIAKACYKGQKIGTRGVDIRL